MSTELGATGRVGILRWRDLRLAERVRYDRTIGRGRRGHEEEMLKSLRILTRTTFKFNATFLNVLREIN